jgi:hypothetical protein
MNTPPKLAVWLLTHFCTARHTDSLIGDLHEQRAAGRGPYWYWRQVLIALVISAARGARENGLSFIGALALAWLAMLAWFAMNMSMTGSHTSTYEFVHERLGIANGHYAWMTIWFFTATTRLICFALAGWLAVRTHRRHAYVVAIALVGSAWLWHFVPWRVYHAFDDSVLVLVHNATAVGGLLIGAAWGIYKEKRRALANTASS